MKCLEEGICRFALDCKKNTVKMHDAHALNVAGKSLSTSLTSWLKRLIIRPSGVRSKNDVGARMTLYNKSLCKKRAAPNAPRNIDSVARNTLITIFVLFLNEMKKNNDKIIGLDTFFMQNDRLNNVG